MERWGTLCWLLVAFAILQSVNCAWKINARHAMERARRERDLSNLLTRDKRQALMGLGENEELKPRKEVDTVSGTKKVKFEETYHGVKVEGASAVFEEDQDGTVTSDDVSGTLISGIEDDLPSVKPEISATDAFKLAAIHNQDNVDEALFDPKNDATLEVYLADDTGDAGKARLVYKLSYRIEKKGDIKRPYFIIDANTGDIISKWNGLSLRRTTSKRRRSERIRANYKVESVGGNVKGGKNLYDGKHFPKLNLIKNKNRTCSLKNNVVVVHDCEESWDCEEHGREPLIFDCEEGISDEVNGGYSPLSDALYYVSVTYEMFDEWFGIKNPIEKEEGDMEPCYARVHFGEGFDNAFWDGYHITFGDGNRTFYPMTSMNVIAHEIAHGITNRNSDLRYYGESGGMNEAFSDMAGEAVEFYATQKADYLVGFDTFKHPDKSLRYFMEPEKDGKSVGEYRFYCPDMDPHFSSGVFNRAFYFLGTTAGWDVKKAFSPFVIANLLYWTPNSRFNDAACGVVQAAKDLGMNPDDVTKAFQKVGVEPCSTKVPGLLELAEVTVPKGHDIIVEFEIPPCIKIDKLRILFYGGKMDVTVNTPKCELCAQSLKSFEGQIDVCDIQQGTYKLVATAQQDIAKGAILLQGPRQEIFSNVTVKSMNDTFEFEFEVDKEFYSQYQQAMFEMKAETGRARTVLRYGEKPDLNNYLFDYYIGTDWPAIACNLKQGKYYGVVGAQYPTHGIKLDLIGLINGRRLDKPPMETRPPKTTKPTTTEPIPTAPGSASGHGSGDETSGDYEAEQVY